MSESLRTGILLAGVGGFLDIYTYLVRGKVFANAQTGNIILLSLNMAEGNWGNALHYLIPILAFVLGVITAEWIRQKYKNSQIIHWRQIIILVEIAILSVAAFIPQGEMNILVNVMISFVCSVQAESFRKVRGSAFATTMCTGNLRSATEELFQWWRWKDKTQGRRSVSHITVILFFIAGGIMGTVLTKAFEERAVIVCNLLLAVVFLLMFRRGKGIKSIEKQQ